MDILLAEESPPGGYALGALIEALGHRVVGPVPGGREAVMLLRQRRADLAVLALEEPGGAAEAVAAACSLPLVLVVRRHDAVVLEQAARLPVFACLLAPVPAERLATALRLASARYEETRVLRSRVAELTRRMEGRSAVERAKGVLMEVRGISEGDAYRLLRRESQNRRKSLAEIATAVLATEKVFRVRGGERKDAGDAPSPEARAG